VLVRLGEIIFDSDLLE